MLESEELKERMKEIKKYYEDNRLIQEGVSMLLDGSYQRAIDIFHEVIHQTEDEGEKSASAFLMALAYVELGDVNKAIRSLSSGLRHLNALCNAMSSRLTREIKDLKKSAGSSSSQEPLQILQELLKKEAQVFRGFYRITQRLEKLLQHMLERLPPQYITAQRVIPILGASMWLLCEVLRSLEALKRIWILDDSWMSYGSLSEWTRAWIKGLEDLEDLRKILKRIEGS